MLRTLGELSLDDAGLDAPLLVSVATLSAEGHDTLLVVPKLSVVDDLSLESAVSLPALRSVGTLYTREAVALPAAASWPYEA